LIPERSVKMKRDAAAEVLSSTVLPGDKENLGLLGKEVTEQEEATTHDDAVIPYHLWDSRLTRLWDGDVLPPPDVAKAAEVIREQFALRFWKLKGRKSFSDGSGNVTRCSYLIKIWSLGTAPGM
jgi:hypothetical protein